MLAPNSRKIKHIFWSTQGEGAKLGASAIFIRLGGCSLRCHYCDTPDAWNTGEWLNISQIQKKVLDLKDNYPHSQLVITGGEPLEQDIQAIVNALRHHFTCIAIETNGLHFQSLNIEWWTISPKDVKAFWIHPLLIPYISEIKLITNENLNLQVIKKIRLISDDFPIFLQPQYGHPNSIRLAFDFFNQFTRAGIPNIRLGIQLHRYYNVP